MVRQIVLNVAVVALMATLFVATESARTCNGTVSLGQLFGKTSKENSGFGVCLFNKTGNGATNALSLVTNTLIEAWTKIVFGKCYCNQDCSPPQVACTDQVDLGFGSISNGVAEIIYASEAYQFYCYCPQYVPDEESPCSSPPTPSQCTL